MSRIDNGLIIDGGLIPEEIIDSNTLGNRIATINYANTALASFIKLSPIINSDLCLTKDRAISLYHINTDNLVYYTSDRLVPRRLLEGRLPSIHYPLGFDNYTMTTEKITDLDAIVVGGYFNNFNNSYTEKSAMFSVVDLSFQGDANMINNNTTSTYTINYGNISIIRKIGPIIVSGNQYVESEYDGLTIYNNYLNILRTYKLEGSVYKVFAIEPMLDGSILVGGKFDGVAGLEYFGGLIKLFDDGEYNGSEISYRTYLDGYIKCICVMSDGSGILLGGVIRDMGISGSKHLVKTTLELTPDQDFADRIKIEGNGNFDEFSEFYEVIINSIVERPDGTFLIGGDFSTIGGEVCNNIGVIDRFGDVVYYDAFSEGFNGIVNDIIIIDEYYYICGEFTEYRGVPCGGIVCIDMLGRIVDEFSLYGFSNDQFNITQTSPKRMRYLDGKIFVNGIFEYYAGNLAWSYAVLTKWGEFYAGYPVGVTT